MMVLLSLCAATRGTINAYFRVLAASLEERRQKYRHQIGALDALARAHASGHRAHRSAASARWASAARRARQRTAGSARIARNATISNALPQRNDAEIKANAFGFFALLRLCLHTQHARTARNANGGIALCAA